MQMSILVKHFQNKTVYRKTAELTSSFRKIGQKWMPV